MGDVRTMVLGHLAVRDFALIEELEAELHPGLNVITGETGAGKSLFVDAVEITLGGRASSEYIRTGTPTAYVQALFFARAGSPPEGLFEETGTHVGEDGEILLERELRRDGQNRARVNGRLTSVNAIRKLAGAMVDLHGQHQQQGLMNGAQQLEVLDALGGEEVQSLRREVSRLHGELGEVRIQLRKYLGDEKERARELDLLRYQLEEIDAAELDPQEEEELGRTRKILGNLEVLRSGIAEVLGVLMDGAPGRPPAVDAFGELSGSLGRLAEIDDNLRVHADSMEAMQYEVQETARALRRYADGLQYDSSELRRVEDRLDAISRLKRKYGNTVGEVLQYREQMARRLQDIENSRERVEALRQREATVLSSVAGSAVRLSKLRRQTAERIREQVEDELADLSMADTEFDIVFNRQPDEGGVEVEGERVRCSETGIDRIEFMISPNPGEPLRPLRRIASGGELARIMLALRTILAGADSTPVLIFDEIDAGIGGEAGQAVAEKLAVLAGSHQILCVTHLPQIAAMADMHLRLHKETRQQRTISELVQVSGGERLAELARMLGGGVSEEAALEHAQRLLETASEWKRRLGDAGS